MDYINTMGAEDDEERRQFLKDARANSKGLKKAMKSGMPIMYMSMTAFGPVMPGMPFPEGVPPNFALKQAAVTELMTGAATRESSLGNMKYEATYRAYYEDVVESESMWMDFFDERDNYEHAEHTCGILGTLATIYRQRGSLKDCEEVLDMEVKVMTRYKRSSEGTIAAQVRCCDCLEYKMHIIRFNLYIQLKRHEECISLFRQIAEYELKYNLAFEEQQFLFLTTSILNKKPTPTIVRSLSDGDVRKIVLALYQHSKSAQGAVLDQKAKQRVALMTCSGCGCCEDAIGSFKACARCESVFYCSKKCQKDSWKTHKKECNK